MTLVCSVNKVKVSGIFTGIHAESGSFNEMQCCKNLFTTYKYEGWNFSSGNYLFTTDTK